jgi:hypothetical protein
VTSQPTPDPEIDPTLAVAERQLVQLRELVEIAMVAARAFGDSAVAAAGAEKMILGQEWFTPEVGRARACGAKDAAESIQKVTRSARLSMKLEMDVAEIVRDIKAGIVTHSQSAIARCNAGEAPGSWAGAGSGSPVERARRLLQSAGVRAGSCSEGKDSDWTRQETNTERLVEFERPEILPRAAILEAVDTPFADAASTVDWKAWKIQPPKPQRTRVVRMETVAPRLPPTPLAALKAASRPPHAMGRDDDRERQRASGVGEDAAVSPSSANTAEPPR